MKICHLSVQAGRKLIQVIWTNLNILQWLDVKCGEQQQVTRPGQKGLLQQSHSEGQTQMYQQHAHTFDPQHSSRCQEAIDCQRVDPKLLTKQNQK